MGLALGHGLAFGGASPLPPFPGDVAPMVIAQGMLYPPTMAAYLLSFTQNVPAFDVYPVNSAGVAGSLTTINYRNGKLNLAEITAAQGSSGSFPKDMLVSNQLFVPKRYNFGSGPHGLQPTQANMPILMVIDGAPHLICGTDDLGNRRFLQYAVTPNLVDQFLAITYQAYGANDDNGSSSIRAPFFTSAANDLFGVGLVAHSTSADASASAAQATEWRYYNPSVGTGFQNGVPTGIKQSNNHIPIVMSSGASNLRFVFGDEVFSLGSNPFAPFAPASGTALIIGNSNTALGALGYYDNVYYKAAAQTAAFDDAFAATLRRLLPAYDAGVNIVFDGASLPSGLHAYAAYIAGNSQGSASYGLQQAMQKYVSARWTNIAVQGSLTADIQARFPYARALYRAGKKNIYLVNWVMLNSTDAASLANTFHSAAASAGQTWDAFVVMGTGDRTGTEAANNAAVAAAANASPTPGSGYSFIPGLRPATWSAALSAGYTTQKLNAFDGSHLAGPACDMWASLDSAPALRAVIAALP